MSIENNFQLSRLRELTPDIKSKLSTMGIISKCLDYHIYHLAAATVLGDESILLVTDNSIDMEIYLAVLDELTAENFQGYWSDILKEKFKSNHYLKVNHHSASL